ncbi:MAG: GtrA family protein [Motiliproteus sp.]
MMNREALSILLSTHFGRVFSIEAFRFIVIGVVNTAFSYSFYAFFIFLGFSYFLASLFGLVLGVLFSFKTQGSFVFKNKNNNIFFLFVVNWIFIYLCMVGFITVFVNYGVNEYWSGVLALGPVTVLSYLSQKFIVFKKEQSFTSCSPAVCQSPPISFVTKNYRLYLRRMLVKNGYGEVTYGANTYGAPIVRWWGERSNLIIGRYCSLAQGVEIFLGGNHRIDWISTYPFPAFRKWRVSTKFGDYRVSCGDVNIGNDVWLGKGCVILSGVTIGHGAVVASYAVVTKDVPDYAIIAGNPGRVVRMRFTDTQIMNLNRIAWWNWDEGKVSDNAGMILSPDIDRFIDKYSVQKKEENIL